MTGMNQKTIFRGARQVADYLGVSPNAIHVLVNRGLLPVRRQGRRLIFVKAEIDEFFASLPGISVREALRTTVGHAGLEKGGGRVKRAGSTNDATNT